jgi:hypothetical protein
MVAPSDYNLVFIELIDVATLVFALGDGLLSQFNEAEDHSLIFRRRRKAHFFTNALSISGPN